MSTLKGIIRNGQVIVIGPTDLPDGSEVEILPVGLSAVDNEAQMTPDEIARTLAAMEKIEPFEMTDAERAAIEADRQACKEWEKAHFDEHADRLRGFWESGASSWIPGSPATSSTAAGASTSMPGMRWPGGTGSGLASRSWPRSSTASNRAPPATATCRGCGRPYRPGGSGRSTTKRRSSTAA
jgi:hypothetical protein